MSRICYTFYIDHPPKLGQFGQSRFLLCIDLTWQECLALDCLAAAWHTVDWVSQQLLSNIIKRCTLDSGFFHKQLNPVLRFYVSIYLNYLSKQ